MWALQSQTSLVRCVGAGRHAVATWLSRPVATLGGQRVLSTSAGSPDKEEEAAARQQGLFTGVDMRRDVFTIPNVMSMARIAASPALGYLVASGHYKTAAVGVVVAGLTDFLDGYIARAYNQQSPLGSVLDPFADKVLMTSLVVALGYTGLIYTPVAALIIGRDVALVMTSFYIRYKTLPPPFTLSRFFNVAVNPAEVKPTTLSRVNTALQLALVSAAIASPVLGFVGHPLMDALTGVVALTTIASGISYMNPMGRLNFRRRPN